ncbi:MAG: recombinase RecA [SAR202 cluster bacterium]|nr:recombinase RecA [SAR202 cluster bacterium]
MTTVSHQQSERRKALDLAIAQVERQYGKGTIMRMGEAAKSMGTEVISTGSLALDLALGAGGLPRGRVTEIYGAEASGKTTLALHVVASAQRSGGTAAYLDAEHALDPSYAKKLGVNVDEMYISQPDYAEQTLDIADYLARSSAVDVIVIDSVAALVPKAELEGDIGDQHIGLQARLMSQALRKLTGNISRSKSVVIFINQLREKVGVVFGNPEVTSGGRALKFYASVRLDLRRIEAVKHGNDVVGARIRARVVKNKVAPPFRTAEFDIMFSQGISKTGDLLDLGVAQGLLKKNGSFYSYGETRLGQGREAAREFLTGHSDMADKIEREIRTAATVSYELGTASSDEEEVDESPVSANGAVRGE